ncbi:1,4-alpha-glucan branching protein GlgB [Limosilactobacillus gastricus]|uniref:1,4-alpha-glucan branching enzyme GlgB n=1 Tax=Limosilactobacillus gastricus DSM 16045 TaxID=1423749 RepID=A0A0R1VJQ7_9LACO|nr:1,4-alpha-glucan branching protein GlgB [Limosilactobacillus gastricus]KRM03684.1 1,4-alpha-glucan-branching enzyme [Limosilactobacillus gastricus DSM 16045]QGF39868.1 1,4-alpha-glucan branching protein GlgB [Limosilactobacillus gastricus]
MEEFKKRLTYFAKGEEYHLQDFMGCHRTDDGFVFRVWAPHAKQVWVVGDFNDWQKTHPMVMDDYGIWSITINRAQTGQLYKFLVQEPNGKEVMKIDPMALRYEARPGTAAMVTEMPTRKWHDGLWKGRNKRSNNFSRPMNIYEVHPASWKQHADGSLYQFKDLTAELIPYVKEQGFNYIEFMPLTEHPLDASWGYQVTGYFALAHAYGEMADFQEFVDTCHQANIGVLIDWVPGHFCINADALAYYDGTPTYEYQEKWRAENRGWGALNFDLGKPEVVSFLLSSALFWIENYHVDGLRVDAVSNMLYRDYDRGPGEWEPDQYGGNRNLEGIAFLHTLNRTIKWMHPEVLMIAEESSSQVKITGRIEDGGLGFDYKWNMGWMNDQLDFYRMDPYFRKDNFNQATFSFMYRMSENFILPLSHDEVVHGKRSLMNKMWGDRRQQFDQLRLLLTMQMTYPGKKLLFMGGEYGQYLEWRFNEGLEWSNQTDPLNDQMLAFDRSLNHFYLQERALWELEQEEASLVVIDADNRDESVLSFIRQGKTRHDFVVVILNFTPVERDHFTIGVPYAGIYHEVFNSALKTYGGTWETDNPESQTVARPFKQFDYQLETNVPAFGALILKPTKVTIKPHRHKKK